MSANPACVSPDSKHMNAFIEDILTRIQDLLELAPPVGGPTDPCPHNPPPPGGWGHPD